MLEVVEKAGVFHGYLEDLVYTPKTLKALASVSQGAIGRVLWTRSREAHPGPHSDWFWAKPLSGGGAIVDMGCHCIEIGRSFVGKDVRPVEVDVLGRDAGAPDRGGGLAVGLVRYDLGAMAQFEVSWTFRGGMDLRDEVSGTDGTIWLNHWLRTGFEMFTAAGSGRVCGREGRERVRLAVPGRRRGRGARLRRRCSPTCSTPSSRSAQPMETFYDGYVVNAIMDACYRSIASKRWERVNFEIWRGGAETEATLELLPYDEQSWLIKKERMPDGRTKLILKDRHTGEVSQRVE